MNFLKVLLLMGVCLMLQQCMMTEASNSENKLVWSDEFDYEGLPDSTKWSYDVGDGCPNLCGWGNNELQYYTNARAENARAENGNLVIETHKEGYESKGYSSARLVSKYKGDWLYGRFEIRAKLPSGVGTWSAIWMLPTDWEYGAWPASGEIDIMEHVGFEPDSIFGTAHTKAFNGMIGTHVSSGISILDCEQAFHKYAIEWTKNKLDYFVDDVKYFTFENQHSGFEEWPFDKRFHFIMNLAVGGDWGGKKGVDESIWPQRMEIDYVRVFSLDQLN